jgi:hypothetical protein
MWSNLSLETNLVGKQQLSAQLQRLNAPAADAMKEERFEL